MTRRVVREPCAEVHPQRSPIATDETDTSLESDRRLLFLPRDVLHRELEHHSQEAGVAGPSESAAAPQIVSSPSHARQTCHAQICLVRETSRYIWRRCPAIGGHRPPSPAWLAPQTPDSTQRAANSRTSHPYTLRWTVRET